jgi:hypothetical protein
MRLTYGEILDLAKKWLIQYIADNHLLGFVVEIEDREAEQCAQLIERLSEELYGQPLKVHLECAEWIRRRG